MCVCVCVCVCVSCVCVVCMYVFMRVCVCSLKSWKTPSPLTVFILGHGCCIYQAGASECQNVAGDDGI